MNRGREKVNDEERKVVVIILNTHIQKHSRQIHFVSQLEFSLTCMTRGREKVNEEKRKFVVIVFKIVQSQECTVVSFQLCILFSRDV